jgi:hypothetical protein
LSRADDPGECSGGPDGVEGGHCPIIDEFDDAFQFDVDDSAPSDCPSLDEDNEQYGSFTVDQPYKDTFGELLLTDRNTNCPTNFEQPCPCIACLNVVPCAPSLRA